MTNSSNAKAVVRPLPVTAAVVAVLSGLAGIGLSFLGLLVGWGIGGTPGTVGDVLRSAVNLWLLSHRAGLRLDSELYTLAPLGLTIVWVWIAFRATRWAAATAPRAELIDLVQAGLVFVGTYAVIAEVAAVLATRENASANLVQVLAGSAGVALVAGACGLAIGSGVLKKLPWIHDLPDGLDARTLHLGARVVKGVLLAAAVVALASGLWHAGEVAASFARLDVGFAEGALVVVLMVMLLPNAILWSLSALLGPGFSVGTGTYVSVSAVKLGPLPAFPLLAALPNEGAAPWWTSLLLTVPAIVTIGLVVKDLWANPVLEWRESATRGAAAGGGAGLFIGVLVGLSGGSMGSGLLAHVGPHLWAPLSVSVLTLGMSGVMAAVGVTALQRRWDPSLQTERKL